MANDLTITRGDSRSFDVDINKPDGSAYDLTGATVQMSGKRHGDDPDYRAIFRKTSAGGQATIVITDAAAGKARIDMKPTDTRDVPAPATLFYDVSATFPSGTVVTPITGKLAVGADATRA